MDGEGYVEETIFLVGTPQAVISEGIAMIALELVLGAEIDAVAARVFAGVGIDYDQETSRAVRELRDALSACRSTPRGYCMSRAGHATR